ncbi:aminoglycoside phosphotransferase family protein [Micromonospora lupini]|uniref:phosphotransferase family protein n=1 Tax=Micromonospora lupini TaxID=285679 RepID=UPI00224FDBBF|nr:aminoglycoside phosphotransferase family protein [Micromonospora lupini]MCX5066302.1 aminoglycoside phosphotransferase family protein [Micromonospora lupini]
MTDRRPGTGGGGEKGRRVEALSRTQRSLDHDQVQGFVDASFGADRRVVDCGPIPGGGFATVWRVALDDGRDVVLKVPPPPDASLLRYERGLGGAEARYFRLVAARAPQVPVPPLLHYGNDQQHGEWLFSGLLPGRSLKEWSDSEQHLDDGPARHDFGAAIAVLHTVSGDHYGYDGGRASGATWRAAFSAMLGDLLADAADWGVRLPTSPARIRELPDRYAWVLDQVRRPSLLHFDGWDGNVLAEPGPGGVLRLRGIVDGERYLFGDPLMDLVSPLIYRRVEDDEDHPFLRGYRAAAAEPLVFDEATLRRLSLYRLHLYLLMTVEMPSRGITRETRPDRFERLADLLDHELTELRRASPSAIADGTD